MNYRIENLVTTETDKQEERAHINKALKKCGYPEWSLNRKPKDKQKKENESRGLVTIPYVKSISEKIARTLKKYNIDSIHKPMPSYG